MPRQCVRFVFILAISSASAALEVRQLRSDDTSADAAQLTLAAALWNGEEAPEDPTMALPALGQPKHSSNDNPEVNVEIMGLMDTGTNLLQQVLWYNFPSMKFFSEYNITDASPEEKRIRFARKGFWKHANLMTVNDHVRPWVRQSFVENRAVLIAMVRQPLAWLQSIKKAPYKLQHCVSGDDWLTRPCVHPVPAGHSGLDHEIPHNVSYSSLPDIWNKWVKSYETAWSEMFSKVIIVRYEDLVMKPLTVVENIAHQLNLTLGSSVWVLTAPAKSSGEPLGRSEAVEKIRTKGYLWNFSGAELRDACMKLDAELVNRLGYDECKRIFAEANRLATAQKTEPV